MCNISNVKKGVHLGHLGLIVMEVQGLRRAVHGPHEVIRIRVRACFVINEKDIGHRTWKTRDYYVTSIYSLIFIPSHPHVKDLSTVEMQVQLEPQDQV